MTTDAHKALNVALTSHLRQLADLDVTEQAEAIVRDAYSEQLLDNVDSVLRQLDLMTEYLTWVRNGNDLNAIAQGEERLCGMQHLADSVLSRHTFHAAAAQCAQAIYQQERRAVLDRIEALQAAIEACQQVIRHRR